MAAATVLNTGFEHDRQFFVGAPQTGEVVTQRENPLMATIVAELSGDPVLRLETPAGKCDVAVEGRGTPSQYKFLRRDIFTGYDCGESVAQLLEDTLGHPARLMWRGDMTRKVDALFAGEGVETIYSDGFPFLVTTMASLSALNQGLQELGFMTLGMDRFRPNLVVEGDFPPFDEDNWKIIRIGDDVILELPKPCARCPVPATDQTTGERSDSTFHIQGLKHIGRMGIITANKKPGAFFGMNAMAVKGFGRAVSPGAQVEVLARHDQPLWTPLAKKAA